MPDDLPANTYRGEGNPLYWKNKMPDQAYWQQDVHYYIKADVNEVTDIIDGYMVLDYWNNSPDTLHEVFFHLYQNAFQPGSYYDKLLKHNHVHSHYGKYESEKKGTTISSIDNGRHTLYPQIDNTIMRVKLLDPIAPGGKERFQIAFKTHFDRGEVRRRMKTFNGKPNHHYDGVHWYPRIDVYDRKFGWTPDQHYGREFYGDFGTFDVELTFSSNFVVEATGKLLNQDEVLPADLREKLDLKNFINRAPGTPVSEITPYDVNQRKTWKYHAENVHDFAFTADPTYRIGEAQWNGIRCIALVQESAAPGWANAAEYSAKIIETFSRDFGMYEYPKIIVADARDGMEYPMITLDGGKDPGYRGLLVHEIGHNWFFGMLGNNETYRAYMDEGFTQFLTAWGLEAIDGKDLVVETPTSAYKRNFKKPVEARESRVFYSYLSAVANETDHQLNTHSDNFRGAVRQGGGYRLVYSKAATMLYNLQYVLGDELFLEAMQNYVARWKIAHPYPSDFRTSIIDFTNVDLNWFFDQWLETTKSVDYGVCKVEQGANSSKVHFKRYGRMHMPIDFRVVYEDGKTADFYIPNTWFEKKTSAKTLAKWEGWDGVNKEYIATIPGNGRIVDVIIDPSNRLADENMLNNSKKFPLEVNFDSKVWNLPDRKKYQANWRPDVWWNAYDGLKLGLHVNGKYFRNKHKIWATAWYNSQLLQGDYTGEDSLSVAGDPDPINFNFEYSTPIKGFMRGGTIYAKARYLDGQKFWSAGVGQQINPNNEMRLSIQSMWRSESDKNYLLYQSEWLPEQYNNSLNLEWNNKYRYNHGRGNINLGLRSNAVLSDYDFSRVTAELLNRMNSGKIDWRTRVFGQWGTGSNVPRESSLFLAGANPEEMMENKFSRANGILPIAIGNFGNTTDHLHMGGGLNLRGYSGYVGVTQDDNDSLQHLLYRGKSGASVSAEMDFDKLLKIKNRKLNRAIGLDTYLFGDAGFIVYENSLDEARYADPRIDLGLGAMLTVKRWGPLEMASPLSVRVDFPLFLSHVPFQDPDNFQFRWVVGINRAF